MNSSVTVPCPRCGADITLEHIIEKHYVHNGVGREVVGHSQWDEITDSECDCDLTAEEEEEVFEVAEEQPPVHPPTEHEPPEHLPL